MRAWIFVPVCAGLVPVLPTPAIAQERPVTYSGAGLTVTVPAGWHIVHERLTPCTNPLERLTLSGRGALVTLMETFGPPRYVQRLSPRPHTFTLRGKPQWIACCAPRDHRGWLFRFRDRGRGFYVYVYVGRPGTGEEALGVLDTLRVRPRSR